MIERRSKYNAIKYERSIINDATRKLMFLLGLLFPCAMIKDSLRFKRRINGIQRDTVRDLWISMRRLPRSTMRRIVYPPIIYNRAPHSSALMNPAVFMTVSKNPFRSRRICVQAASGNIITSKRWRWRRHDSGVLWIIIKTDRSFRDSIRSRACSPSLSLISSPAYDFHVNRKGGYTRVSGRKTSV